MIVTAGTQTPRTVAGRELPAAVDFVLGDLRGKLDGELLAVAADPQRRFLSLEEGGVLRRWNPRSGAQVQASYLSDLETTWSFSDDGRWLASGDGVTLVWNVEAEPTIAHRLDADYTTALAFSPDGRFLATGHADHTVALWDVANGERVETFYGHQHEINAIAFSPDGATMATAGEDRRILLWDWAEGTLAKSLEGPTDKIDAVAWSPDGRRLASSGWDGAVRVWDPARATLVSFLNGHGDQVHTVKFLPMGRGGGLLVSGDCDGAVRIWDYARVEVMAEFRRHRGAVSRLAISADGLQLATGGVDRAIVFWDLMSAKPTYPVLGPISEVVSVTIGKDGAVAIHAESAVASWDAAQGIELHSQFPTNTRAIATDDLGRWAVGTEDGDVLLFRSLGRSAHVEFKSAASPVRRLAFGLGGATLATAHAEDSTLRLWNGETGKLQVVIPEATLGGTVEAIAFHPNQPVLAAAGINWKDGRPDDPALIAEDIASDFPSHARIVLHRLPFQPEGAIVLWDLAKWEVLLVLETGAVRVAFHPDGKLLAAVTLDEAVVLFDVENGRLVHDFALHELSVKDLAFDPAGNYLAAGCSDGMLRVWDCKTWGLRAQVDLETKIRSLGFTADGSTIVAGNGNSTCYAINLRTLLTD